ncbi:transposase [Niameybacter sp.]
MYCIRWQIELLFKVLKSTLKSNSLRKISRYIKHNAFL